jgi:hypothetical protein
MKGTLHLIHKLDNLWIFKTYEKIGKDLIPKMSSKPVDVTQKIAVKGIDGAIKILGLQHNLLLFQ